MQVTVITPIAPHHEKQFVRCADSVRKQTIECRHLHMVDTGLRGPAYIRNLLLEQVRTKFVVFLDADDYLEPTFVEECMKASTPESYVATDWYESGQVKSKPSNTFWGAVWHLVTCLIHTDMARIVKGFNEKFPAMEDTEFFLKLHQFKYCATRVKKPLLHYTNEGKRSNHARQKNMVEGIKQELSRRFQVGCCSEANNQNGPRPAVGKKMPGDVEVMALWEGNQVTGGAMTGRRYQRASRPMKIWIDPQDALARPDLYRIIPPATKVNFPKKVSRRRVKKPKTFADMLHAAGMLELPGGSANVLPVADGIINPDFEKLNEIAQRIYNVQSKPKRSIESNSQTDIVVTGQADTVRNGSTTRGTEAGRDKPVAIGDGKRKRETDAVRDSQGITAANGD
jgi:hypothetical protein